ncbi:MAG: hypothetical protein, partial [Olavius algarvensis Gamma 3 endosymbiont]
WPDYYCRLPRARILLFLSLIGKLSSRPRPPAGNVGPAIRS